MTIEQLAEKTCKTLNLTPYSIGYSVIKRALQEQDKITRHACADAILALPRQRVVNESTWDGVDINQASAACINVKTE